MNETQIAIDLYEISVTPTSSYNSTKLPKHQQAKEKRKFHCRIEKTSTNKKAFLLTYTTVQIEVPALATRFFQRHDLEKMKQYAKKQNSIISKKDAKEKERRRIWE